MKTALEYIKECEDSGLFFYPKSTAKASELLQNNGFSKEDADYAANAVYRLNEGFDGEPVSAEHIAGQAAKAGIAKLKEWMERA